jgi:hypothetical protein
MNRKDIAKVADQKRHLHLLQKLGEKGFLSERETKELKKFEAAEENRPGLVFTYEDLAYVFGVSRQAVHKWLKENMPVESDGSFNIRKIQQWRSERSIKETDGDDFKKLTGEVKYRLLKLELEREEGSLISRQQVKDDLGNEILIIKQHFLSLPRQLAPQLFGLEIVEIEKVLEKKIKEIILGFAKGKY